MFKELVLDEDKHDLVIPAGLFNKDLGTLETLVKYLRENLGFKHKKISEELNRNISTVLTTYRKANIKSPDKFVINDMSFSIPVSIFKDRKFSNLELLAAYLKDNYSLQNHEIAALIDRDDRTIWTVLKRYKNKKDA